MLSQIIYFIACNKDTILAPNISGTDTTVSGTECVVNDSVQQGKKGKERDVT